MSATPPRPAATTWVDFDRPVEEVRALFFDVDLAVRSKIHRGMRLQWTPPEASGPPRLRQHTRVLDKVQTEDVVIERGPGGVWVKRFLEGPNAGSRFEARLEPQGERATRATMEAYVGPNGFAQGLGKLSALGLEKAMKRLMGEYRLALQGYQPGRARGAVLAALSEAKIAARAMRALDDGRRKLLTATLLEAAWAIACVDEGPDEAERDAMRAIVASIWQATLSTEIEDRMMKAAVDAIARHGAEERCDALGKRLRASGFAELGISLAVLVAEVSHGLAPEELAALRRMAAAAGVDEPALMEIVKKTDEDLSGAGGASPASSFV
jgi:hypothetical protein